MNPDRRRRNLPRHRPHLGKPPISAVGLAGAAGAAWALSAPPREWWVLMPLGVAALVLSLLGRPLRERLLLCALAGLAYFGPTLWWIHDFSFPGYIATTLLETLLLVGVLGLIPANRQGRWSGGWWALPAALVLLEAVQTRFPFGGFPLPTLALSQLDGPFAAAAPLGGSLLVTTSAAVGGVALAAPWVLPRFRQRILAALGLLLAASLPVALGTRLTTTAVGVLDVAVVQGGGPRGVRAVFTDPGDVTRRHLAVAQQIDGSPDLVLMPENVVDVDGRIADSPVAGELGALANRLDSSLVVGVTESTATGFHNASVLWGPSGRRLDRYEKEHRVPFGEYIPARNLLEKITDATALVPSDATPGRGKAVLRSPIGSLGVVISYEVFFADRVREAVENGAPILLVPTNTSSYVTDEVPAIQLAAARLRAKEFGRSIVLAAPTGYSAVILPNGQIQAQTPLGTASLLRERVPLLTGLTPYARAGDTWLIAIAAAALTLGPLGAWACRSTRDQRAMPSTHRRSKEVVEGRGQLE